MPALTFAAHGERTIIVDCDLRKPTIHKFYGIENQKGVIDYCADPGSPGLDDLIIRGRYPNFDILPAGGPRPFRGGAACPQDAQAARDLRGRVICVHRR